MTNVKKMFEGNYLKADDCKTGDMATIVAAGVPSEIEGDHGKTKEVMNYDVDINGTIKSFTPNMTNGRAMIEAWGEEDEAWVGKKFKIEIVQIRAFGKKVNSIEIECLDPKPKVPVAKVK
ncbi:MAG TPA: hypothetical protein VMW10_08015 [Alphaproteobacteria bacterium]|nr:hypothetical protein [Alphaproteobacteria bacterium]